jgi:DNA repair protein RecO (recombination protein O)
VPAAADDAICIRHWDWSETSQTVSLLTRDHGVLRGLAKGSKRENARFSGGIELLTRGQILFIAKPTSELATLTEWDLAEIFPGLRQVLRRFYAAMFVADLLQHSIRDHDPHPKAFDATLLCLRTLGAADSAATTPHTNGDIDEALARFQWALLTDTGYRPELNNDARSGIPLEPRDRYLFAPHLGGLLAATPDASVPTWPVRSETIRCLRELSADTPAPAPQSPETWERAARLLAAYFREVLGQPLASLHQVFAASSLPRAARSG